jgi:hypothetical protein
MVHQFKLGPFPEFYPIVIVKFNYDDLIINNLKYDELRMRSNEIKKAAINIHHKDLRSSMVPRSVRFGVLSRKLSNVG